MMGMLQSPMISAMPGSPAAALLARERQSRREGSGIQIEQLLGCWMLQQTWTRSGDAPTPHRNVAALSQCQPNFEPR